MLQTDESVKLAAAAPVLREYLSDKELATELNVSPRTLARWRRLREGPAITRIGRKIVYRRASVNEWLASCELGE
jgi:transposase-like protein